MLSVVRPNKMRPNSGLSSADDTETRRKHSRTSSLMTVARIALFSFLRRREERFLCGLLVFIVAQGISVAQSKPEEVVFSISGRELHGFIWKPEGTGTFPAILWNHGSEKLPGSQPALARFYIAHSYVFFVPHRRGQGRSPGDYIQDLVAQAPPGERARRMVELQQAEVDDVVAALNYLRSQLFVNPDQIAISGCSYGGIQTLLTGERNLGVKALVPFAPGAMSWEQNVPLQDRLVRAVDLAKAPVFLIQAENDYSLAPSRVLSKEANKKKKDFQSKVYPAFGSTHQDGHWGFCSSATDVWGNDVLAFLETQMRATH
jgi:carboxymethylenebutenolidase